MNHVCSSIALLALGNAHTTDVDNTLVSSKRNNVDQVYGTNSDGDDLNVTIKARNTNLHLNSIVSGTVSRDIVREEDVRVEYLVRCSKEHDLLKGNPNSVDHECSENDIDIVLNPTIIKKEKYNFIDIDCN
ncbi:hypothetical protein PR048_023684, partial [Dryococelus australis]